MKLMEKILSKKNLEMAIRKVKQNKGAPGVDKMTVYEIEDWFNQYKEEIISKIMNKQYRPMPVKRVYIPKPNGKQRPLGIPTVVDRVIQQAMLQVLTEIYEPIFSEHSFGFRPRRSAHMAMEEVLQYLNEGDKWIVDLDIEKFFDTVNHDVMKETGFMSYPGISYGRGSLVNFKISDSTLGRKRFTIRSQMKS